MKPFDSSLEHTLTSCLDERVIDVASNREAVRASWPVGPFVHWVLSLPIAQNLISSFLFLRAVHGIKLT